MCEKVGYILLHPLQPWPARFVCGDAAYFWESTDPNLKTLLKIDFSMYCTSHYCMYCLQCVSGLHKIVWPELGSRQFVFCRDTRQNVDATTFKDFVTHYIMKNVRPSESKQSFATIFSRKATGVNLLALKQCLLVASDVKCTQLWSYANT